MPSIFLKYNGNVFYIYNKITFFKGNFYKTNSYDISNWAGKIIDPYYIEQIEGIYQINEKNYKKAIKDHSNLFILICKDNCEK